MYRNALPQLGSEVFFLTDSGLETDLIFNEGFELPEFASFVLVDDPGRARRRWRRISAVMWTSRCSTAAGCSSRRRRGGPAGTGGRGSGIRRRNCAGSMSSAAGLLSQVRGEYRDAASSPVVVSGCIGPRADAYRPAECMG